MQFFPLKLIGTWFCNFCRSCLYGEVPELTQYPRSDMGRPSDARQLDSENEMLAGLWNKLHEWMRSNQAVLQTFLEVPASQHIEQVISRKDLPGESELAALAACLKRSLNVYQFKNKDPKENEVVLLREYKFAEPNVPVQSPLHLLYSVGNLGKEVEEGHFMALHPVAAPTPVQQPTATNSNANASSSTAAAASTTAAPVSPPKDDRKSPEVLPLPSTSV